MWTCLLKGGAGEAPVVAHWDAAVSKPVEKCNMIRLQYCKSTKDAKWQVITGPARTNSEQVTDTAKLKNVCVPPPAPSLPAVKRSFGDGVHCPVNRTNATLWHVIKTGLCLPGACGSQYFIIKPD